MARLRASRDGKEGGLRVTLVKAVVRAAERARQLVESQNT